MAPNTFLLAADASPQLLPLLRENPSLVTKQDDSGYSLLHALVSYRHLDLLRTLVRKFSPPLDLRDEDGETALFVAESVEAARCLLEELGGAEAGLVGLRNGDDQTAEEKMRAEIDEGYAEDSVLEVVEYLATFRSKAAGEEAGTGGQASNSAKPDAPPALPPGIKLQVGTMAEDEAPGEVDEEFRRRIEQLAARDDFTGDDSQRELKALVQDAVRDIGSEDRDVRRRVE